MGEKSRKKETKSEKKVREQSRKWLLTFNNPDRHGMGHDEIKRILSGIENLDYWCMCDEIGGKTACYHTHLFFYRKSSAMKFTYMKSLFPSAHFDYPMGTAAENREYIRKEGKYLDSEKSLTNLKDTFEEFGECPVEEQGKRNDLYNLYGLIKDGLSDFDILEENSQYMTRLDTIGRVREVIRYEQFSNCLRDVHVEYWYGKSGAGKTSSLYKRYGFSVVYTVDDYRHPWDGYKGQDVVFFDEFLASNYDVALLLRWLDVYPVQLPCRYSNKQACYTKVFFASNYSFEEQFGFLRRGDPEIFAALLRRFHCFKVFGDNGSLQEYDSYESYSARWQHVDDKEVPFLEGKEKGE